MLGDIFLFRKIEEKPNREKSRSNHQMNSKGAINTWVREHGKQPERRLVWEKGVGWKARWRWHQNIKHELGRNIRTKKVSFKDRDEIY